MIIASAIILDSCIGLLYQSGSLNLVDWVLAGSIPNDLVWLTQVIEGISGAFFIVKILFDDLPRGALRSSLILLSLIHI